MPCNHIKRTFIHLLLLIMVCILILPPLSVSANGSLDLLDGQITITESSNTEVANLGSASSQISESDSTVEISVTAFAGRYNIFGATAIDTIIITNKSASKAELKFSYSASNYSAFSLGSAGGEYSAILGIEESITITLKAYASKNSSTTAELKLSNLNLTPLTDSDVTILYDINLGSVTANGSDISSGKIHSVEADGTVTLAATATGNGVFMGWINEADNSLLSNQTSFDLAPISNISVRAVFRDKTSSNPWLLVGSASAQSTKDGLIGTELNYYTVSGAYLFDDLNKAASFAAESANKYIVLMNDATLASGTYTIPAGVTLLIPFDDSNTLYTDEAVGISSYSTPTAYRTLTLKSGAELIINGTASLSAQHRRCTASAPGGAPTGKVSFIKMQPDSKITINNGGALYVYGYITGSGTVTANSGAKVYENFQIADYRGGTQSSSMENEVFPLSQYYVQNIEVPLTLYSGAYEYAFTTIYASDNLFGTAVAFIGPSGTMFNLTDGEIIKQYDGTTDRLMVEMTGTMNIANIDIRLSLASINSSNYNLPITNNLDLTINSGSNVTTNQDLIMLPGARITISENATFSLGQGYNMYIFDSDEWGNYCYYSGSKTLSVLRYAPSRTYTRTADDLVDAYVLVNGILDASNGYLYTTSSGANICSTGTGVVKIQLGTESVTYQYDQTNKQYDEIAIVPARLLNANTENNLSLYTETTSAAGNYYYHTDHQRWVKDEHMVASENTATCITSGIMTHTCNCGFSYTEDIDATGHTWDETTGKCTVCGSTTIIDQKGRTLSYEDMIYVIDIFDLKGIDLEKIDLTTDAGLLIWSVEEFEALTEVAFDETHANVGLFPYKATGYYCGMSDGIYTRDLHVDAYYVGYVKLSDGTYIYSAPKLYSPAIYAHNMLGKTSSQDTTKTLCVALLNYISAAQMYFYPETAEEDLVNYRLTDGQRAMPEWNLDDLALAPEVPDEKKVAADTIFTDVGKNLLFEEMVSICALYKIDDATVTAAKECGTIFWTAAQFDALSGAPSVDNYGSGTKVSMTQYKNTSGQWVSHAPKIAAKDMSSTTYYFLGYVIDENGTPYYSGVISYTVEQYIYKKADSEAIGELVKRLYFYERAAKAALSGT